ncbi:MAG: AAA family ATPase [Pseudomonadota bacterium]
MLNLTLKNVGIIKNAQICLNGLTVIAGENDTGKSTVGKLMFAIIKALSRFEQDLNEDKKKHIRETIESIYFKIRKLYSFQKYPALKQEFHPDVFVEEVEKLLAHNHLNELNLLDKKRRILNNINSDSIHLEKINLDFEALNNLITQKEDKKSVIKRALTKALVSEFHFELSPKHAPLKSFIQIEEGMNNIFEIEIEDNQIVGLEFYDEVFFNDVTFIETPILLQMYDIVNSASTLLEIINEDNKVQRLEQLSKPKVSLHLKDLISKLENSQYFSLTFFDKDNFLIDFMKQIQQLIDGNFYFDKKLKDFVFKRATNQEQITSYRSVNTASGIKSFGTLQLLVESQFLDARSLLIIDEPETHLHPQWQVEYAKLIVMLVENHIPVLLSSHSPYMIQALKVLSENSQIKNQTNYYLAAPTEDNLTEIVNVTDDLNQIFKILSKPLQKLVWN